MSDENNIQQLFNACVEQNMDKDSTVMAMVTQGGLSVTQAVRDYQRLAKAAGIVLSSKERTEKVNEMLAEYNLVETDQRRKALEAIVDEFDVSEATAGAHIRTYCEDNNIELPTQNRNSLEDMVAFVDELIKAGKERAQVVEALQNEMGYTANSAASAYSRATRELGISTGRVSNTVPLNELVAFVREHDGKPRKQLAKMMHEELGYAVSTANSFLTYVPFAKEWAKQETGK